MAFFIKKTVETLNKFKVSTVYLESKKILINRNGYYPRHTDQS